VEKEMKVEVLCAVCKNRMQSEVLYCVDSAVLTVQCNAQRFSSYIREPRRKLYRLHY
jgi:hypothetical protein